jgi:hypothetical protein
LDICLSTHKPETLSRLLAFLSIKLGVTDAHDRSVHELATELLEDRRVMMTRVASQARAASCGTPNVRPHAAQAIAAFADTEVQLASKLLRELEPEEPSMDGVLTGGDQGEGVKEGMRGSAPGVLVGGRAALTTAALS